MYARAHGSGATADADGDLPERIVHAVAGESRADAALMQEVIDRPVRAFLQGLARGQTAVQRGRPDFSPNLP